MKYWAIYSNPVNIAKFPPFPPMRKKRWANSYTALNSTWINAGAINFENCPNLTFSKYSFALFCHRKWLVKWPLHPKDSAQLMFNDCHQEINRKRGHHMVQIRGLFGIGSTVHCCQTPWESRRPSTWCWGVIVIPGMQPSMDNLGTIKCQWISFRCHLVMDAGYPSPPIIYTAILYTWEQWGYEFIDVMICHF